MTNDLKLEASYSTFPKTERRQGGMLALELLSSSSPLAQILGRKDAPGWVWGFLETILTPRRLRVQWNWALGCRERVFSCRPAVDRDQTSRQ